MTYIIGIPIAIIVFSLIIIIHEWGHFITSRIFGVKVEEFGLGLPPKAKRLFTDKKGTEFTLNYLPLGGFCRLKGEDEKMFQLFGEGQKSFENNQEILQAITDKKPIFDSKGTKLSQKEISLVEMQLQNTLGNDTLHSKPVWQQSIIMLGGVFMNFVLAFLIFVGLFYTGIRPIATTDQIPISSSSKLIITPQEAHDIGFILEYPGVFLTPLEDSIAQAAGIESGDLLTHIDNTEIKNTQDMLDVIGQSASIPLTFTLKRAIDGCDLQDTNCSFDTLQLDITPSDDALIGTQIFPNARYDYDFTYQLSFLESIKYAANETLSQTVILYKGLGVVGQKIFAPKTPQDRQEALEQVGGPIAIVYAISQVVFIQGFFGIALFGAMLSIGLGFFNALPIPALDGGRFFITLINSIFKRLFGIKAIKANLEFVLHVGFFMILIALSVLIAYNDVVNIIHNG